MKQFIEKLIERLEEIKNDNFASAVLNEPYSMGICHTIEKSIKIVNQLAEEYNNCSTDTSTDLTIVQSLPSLYPLQPFEEEAVHRVVEMAKGSNIQTIDVSELLGESEQVKQSNADRLRAMSDEELAEYIFGVSIGSAPCVLCSEECAFCELSDEQCKEKTLKWLQSEVEE